jgi:hypothetical protein
MKSRLLKKLNKYIAVMIFNSLLFAPWTLVFDIFNPEIFRNIGDIQEYGDYLVRLLTIIFLITDFQKEKLNYVIVACISSLFYPFLGIIIFGLLYLEKQTEEAST